MNCIGISVCCLTDKSKLKIQPNAFKCVILEFRLIEARHIARIFMKEKEFKIISHQLELIGKR